MDGCKQIFIVGMPRSGTTLLHLILNSHSKIAIAPETHFFDLFWAKRKQYGNLAYTQNFNRLCNDLINCKYIKNLRISNYAELIKKSKRREAYKSVFQNLLESYAWKHKKEICGEKTPSHLIYTIDILKMFYDAKVVNIVRNPFDVAISTKKVPWGTDNIVDISKRWRKYVKLALRYRKMFKRNFYTVNYEDIIYDPEAEICKICEFLSVDFENKMLEFYRNKDVPIFYKNRYWHKNCFRPISADNIGKGFRELNLQEIKFIAYYCIKYLRLLGYEDLLAKYAEEIGRNSKNNKKVLCDILEIVKFKHIPLAKNNLYRISAFIKRKLALYKRK